MAAEAAEIEEFARASEASTRSHTAPSSRRLSSRQPSGASPAASMYGAFSSSVKQPSAAGSDVYAQFLLPEEEESLHTMYEQFAGPDDGPGADPADPAAGADLYGAFAEESEGAEVEPEPTPPAGPATASTRRASKSAAAAAAMYGSFADARPGVAWAPAGAKGSLLEEVTDGTYAGEDPWSVYERFEDDSAAALHGEFGGTAEGEASRGGGADGSGMNGVAGGGSLRGSTGGKFAAAVELMEGQPAAGGPVDFASVYGRFLE